MCSSARRRGFTFHDHVASDRPAACLRWQTRHDHETAAQKQAETRSGAAPRMEPPRGAYVLLYLSVTVAPAPSRAAFAFSAASLVAFSRTGLGAPSTSAFASPRPRLVSVRTSLMTWIFFSPAASRMTSNSSCSSTASAGAAPPGAPGAARTAAGAAAVTSNVSSNCFTKSESSSSVISLNVSSSSSVLSFAMVGVLSDSPVEPAGWWLLRRLGGSFCGAGFRGWRLGRRLGSVALDSVGLGGVGGWRLGRNGVGGWCIGSDGLRGLLLLQRLGQAGHLRQRSLEQARGSRRQRLECSGDPGQQYLARLEIGDPVDL